MACMHTCTCMHSFDIYMPTTIMLAIYRDSFDVEKVPRSSGKQLVCTHTVRGHASGVLSVTASNILLFTGSQGIFYSSKCMYHSIQLAVTASN